jgi:hypothetical protein
MRYAALVVVVLSVAMAEVYFQEKFDEGWGLQASMKCRLSGPLGEAYRLEEARRDG